MASDILNSEVFQVQVGDTKTVSKKSVSNEIEKEGSSLFDSLLKDAKAKIGEDNGLKKDLKNSLQSLVPNKSQSKPESQVADRIIHNQKQEEKKGSLSLLDKMMQDIKKEIPSDQKIASKVIHQVKDESIETKVSALDNTEVKKDVKDKLGAKKEVIKPIAEIKTLKVNNLLVEKDNQPLQEEIVSKKVSKPASLLDKMVQSIVDNTTEDKDSISDEKSNFKKSEHKLVTKSDENVGKLFAELHNGIKLENKTQIAKTETSLNLNYDETKEITILSSLADSLSGKTKIQKRVDEVAKLESLQDPKAQFGANLFLTNQKVQGDLLSKQKIDEAKDVLKDGEKTTKTVKKSADILELKPKGIELSVEEEAPVVTTKQPLNKSNEIGIHNQQVFLNRVFLNKDNINQINDAKVVEEKIIQTKLSSEDTKKVNQDVTITVERTLVETFTTKVIASKQAMGSFMSDVARNMYLNYKPPLTAFKIQLDPLNLGSIAIVMRNNKSENTLNISLNMSQNTTYDTFSDNKSALQNALGRVFNQNEGSFSLDFGMQNDSSNQEFEQQRQNQENRQIIENKIHGEVTSQDDGQVTELETTKSYM